MPTTNRSAAFPDAGTPPTSKAVRATLGRSSRLWAELKSILQAAHGPLDEEWNFGKTLGWTLRLKRRKRAVVYMTPRRGHFLVSLALGEKACAAAKQAGVPAPMLTIIDGAPKYAEGRGVRIPVRTARDLAGVVTVAALKMAR